MLLEHPRPGRVEFRIWCGPNKEAIQVLKNTKGCFFLQNSKRWFFERSVAEADEVLAKLCSLFPVYLQEHKDDRGR